jgi:hypothetical protein
VGGRCHALAALPPGKTRYQLYRRLGGPQGQSEQVQKILPPSGIRSPDHPARSESLYQLSYPSPLLQKCTSQNLPIFHGLTFTSTSFISTSEVHSHHIGISDNRKLKNQKMWRTGGLMLIHKLVGRQPGAWPQLYCKTREVAHPCKSATCHSWPHVFWNQCIPMMLYMVITV